MEPSAPRVVCGMVLGEASESDDDSDVPSTVKSAPSMHRPENSHSTTKKASKHKLKYNTLLHHKLRDANIALRNDVVAAAEQPICKANMQLQGCLQLQTKTRASFHETPRYLHRLSVALVGLQDRLPLICNINIVPQK